MSTKFNLSDTCDQILHVAKQEMGDGWKKSKSIFEDFTKSNQDRWQMLADLSGELTEDQLKSRLQGEKDMLEAQLNALKVVGAATVQRTVNSINDVILKAIAAAVPF